MKRTVSYYLIPICIFTLLAFVSIEKLTIKQLAMTTLSTIVLGSFAGFVFHMATIIKKKLSS